MAALVLAFPAIVPADEPPPSEALEKALRDLEKTPDDPDALSLVLELAHTAGGVRKLVERFEEKLRTKPENGKVRLVVGHLHRRAGECASAMAHYEEAARQLPRSPGPHAGKADCHRTTEAWPAAIESYEAALTRADSRDYKVEILEKLIQVALVAERPDVLKSAYERMTSLEPGDVFLRVRYARSLVDAGRLELALDVFVDVRRRAGADVKLEVLAVKEIGQILDRLGRHDEAVTVYRQALKRLPAEHWAELDLQEGLIGVYRRQGRLQDYVAELEKRRGSYAVLLLLARLYEEVGADQKALDAYRTAVAERPANVDARASLLRILRRVGTREQLMEEYVRLIAKVPHEPQYELELAGLYFEDGKPERALALLDRMSRRYSADPGVHESIADLLVRHGADAARVEREYEILMRLEPGDEQHIVQLGEYYFGENKPGKAKTVWEKLLTVLSDKGQAHLLLAQLFAEHDMQQEAITHYREAVKLHPKEVRYHRSFAVFLEKVNRYADAQSAWQKIMELTPPDDHDQLRDARLHVIQLMSRQGALTYKLEALRRGFEATPPDVAAGLMLAEGLLFQKEIEEAARVLEQIAKLRPRDPEALTYLEDVYEKLNRLSDAIDVLGRLADLAPQRARPRLERMARLSMELHRADDALKYAKLVVDLNPMDAGAQAHLGDVHVRVRSYEAALAAYRRSLSLTPGNRVVQFALADVLEELGRSSELADVLLEIVGSATEHTDVLNAGRRLLYSPRLEVLEKLEGALLQAVFGRDQRSVYRRLLMELYTTMMRRLALASDLGLDEAAAQRRLQGLGERGLKPILDSLGDSDLAVRTQVLRLLIATRSPNAVLPLVRLLEERDRVLLFQALVALAHIGASSAAGPVSKLTASSEGDVGGAAVWALGVMKDKAAAQAIRLAARTPGRPGEGPAIVALALGMRGSADELDLLFGYLQGGDKLARPFAVWALGAIGDARAVDPLLSRLPAEPEEVQRVIVWALGAIGSPKALEPLLRIALSGTPGQVELARWSVGRILSPAPIDRDAIREVYLSLHDFNRAQLTVVDAAFPALMVTSGSGLDIARLLDARGKAVRQTILELLDQPDNAVRQRVLDGMACAPRGGTGLSLGTLAPDVALPEAWRASVVAKAAALIRDPSSEVRASAVRLLGRSGSPAALEPLSEAMRDSDPLVRSGGAEALASTGRVEALGHLLVAAEQGKLRDAWTGRAALAVGLRTLLPLDAGQHGRAGQVLVELLRDEYPTVRVAALEAVAAAGAGAQPLAAPVIELLRDPDPSVVLAAARALGPMRSPLAVKPLEALERSPDPKLRDAAAKAIERIRGQNG